jgi:hypothetical protein
MYSPEQLKQKNDEPEEHQRCRDMFENIKHRCANGIKVSEHEKEYYMRGVQELYPNENEFEIPNIKSAIVRHLSRIYFRPGKYQPNVNYIKVHRGNKINVPYIESQKEIDWLKEYVEDFINKIAKKTNINTTAAIIVMKLIFMAALKEKLSIKVCCSGTGLSALTPDDITNSPAIRAGAIIITLIIIPMIFNFFSFSIIYGYYLSE